jgi:hypothetical protein
MSRWKATNTLTVLVGCALLCLGAVAEEGELFRIGTLDGRCAEFGLVHKGFNAFSERYGAAVEFTVGEHKDRGWPYIHPSTMDGWAGGKEIPFTIHFSAEETNANALALSLCLAESFHPSRIRVRVNGSALAEQRPEFGGSDRLAYEPERETTGLVQALHFEVPAGAVRPGANQLSIRLSEGSWIIYDAIALGSKPIERVAPDVVADAMEGPLGEVENVLFALRTVAPDGHWYANFSYYAADENRLAYGDGARLCMLNVRSKEVTTLLDDPMGGIRDPQMHYSGGKALFAYRKGGTPNYLLYEINIDGTNLTQLTTGQYDDFEPAYLPDGGIVFVSSRCSRWVNCWLTQVATLHRADGDGSNIRPLSSNNEQDNTPWVLNDGRILYQRWEYVDRSQVHYHHLWSMNPDGTGQMVYFGNLKPGVLMIDAKPIEGTNKVVTLFSPGHGRREHEGAITVVDPGAGPDAEASVRIVRKTPDCRDVYPLSEEFFLAARGGEIVVVDGQGNASALYGVSEEDRKAGLVMHEPRPVRARARERVIPSRSKLAEGTGRFVLSDVYDGRNMDGVEMGEIKKLMILETLPKPVNFTGGMEPLSYGGTFTLERIMGTVPVEEDGSAYMELPALRSFFFIALDENDLAVKRMQSFTTLQPGEVTSCVGCHEHRSKTALPATELLALKRPPSRPEPIQGAPDVFDFPRDIQPILDKHCMPCHDYEGTDKGGPRAGGVLLSGDRGPLFSHSYFTLSAREQLADGRNRPISNYAPRALGSGGSPLLKKIMEGHGDVALSARETKIVRLWIETGSPYPGTYGGLGSGMIGGYEENQIDRRDLEWPEMKAAMKVRAERCDTCHAENLALPKTPTDNMGMPPWAIDYNSPRLRFSRHILYNLSEPEASLLLLAPLSKEAGGWGICREVEEEGSGEVAQVFASTDDPGYAVLRRSIARTAEELQRIKRFDMAGFQPRPGYIREMKRYGILAEDDEGDVDSYALDRAYWESLWWKTAE